MSKIIVKKTNRNTKNIEELFEKNKNKSPTIMEIRIAALRDGWPENIVKKMNKPKLPKIAWNGRLRRWFKIEEQAEIEEEEELGEEEYNKYSHMKKEVPEEEVPEEEVPEEVPEEGFDIDEFKDEEEEEEENFYEEEEEEETDE